MRTEITAMARTRRVGFAMVVLCCVFGGKKRDRDIKDAWPPNLGEGHFRDCGDLGAISRIRSLPLASLAHAMT